MFGWLLAGFAVWWLFLRQGASGMAAQGNISSMSVDGVAMGTHGKPKFPGDPVTVNVAFTGLTKNYQGAGITWGYRIRLVTETSGAVPFQFQTDGPAVSGPFNTLAFSTIGPYNMPTSAPGGLYSVTAFLQAEGSSPTGEPTGVFADIPGAQATHVDAISLQVSGAAVPSGSISSVDVAQLVRDMRL